MYLHDVTQRRAERSMRLLQTTVAGDTLVIAGRSSRPTDDHTPVVFVNDAAERCWCRRPFGPGFAEHLAQPH
jgi:hypothetical protein